MTLGRFSNPSASDISSGLVPVPPPIKQSDVTAVRTNYGIAADFKPKGQSDSSLYDHSVKFVLDWWKKNNPSVAVGTPPGGTGAGSTPGAGGAGGGGAAAGGAGGATMPNTATGTGGPSAADQAGLGHIYTPQEVQAQTLGTQRGSVIAAAATAKSDPIILPSKPVLQPSGIFGVVSKATAQSIMTQMGLKGVTPPSSVLTTATALRAWVTKQLAAQKLAQQRGAQTAAKATKAGKF